MTPTEASHIWEMLAQTFGRAFIENYGPKPNQAWAAAFAAMRSDAAMSAWRGLVESGAKFPPTLPEFVDLARQFRPPESTQRLPGPQRAVSTEELRRAASGDVSAFSDYAEYERWRSANTKGQKKPPHPTPGSPDWEYLHRLAYLDAAQRNARAGNGAF